MSLSDWSSYANAADNHSLIDGHSSSGSSSLAVKDTATRSVTVLDASLSDAPRDGMVQTDVAMRSDGGFCHVFFRFQGLDEYYVTSYGYASGAVYLHRKSDGTLREVGSWSEAKRPDAFADFSFVPVRVRFWRDGTGDLRVSWDYERDGEWTSLADDIFVSSPRLTEGGAIGVGGQPNVDADGSNGSVSFDRTSIHYEQ